MQHWYLFTDDRETGPMTAAELRELLVSGRLKEGDFVSRAGDAEWTPALNSGPRLLEEIAAGPGAIVPPPPPSPTDPLAALAGTVARNPAWAAGAAMPYAPAGPAVVAQLHLGLRGAGPTTTLVILAALTVLVSLATIWNDLALVDLFDRVEAGRPATEREGESIDRTTMILAVIHLLIKLVTIVVFCVWIHGAAVNIRRMGMQGLAYSPAWAAGGFFVPILNLFRPCQVMQEVWRASDPGAGSTDWPRRPASVLVGLWWAVYLLDLFAGRIALAMGEHAEKARVPSMSQLRMAATADMVSEFVAILECVITVAMIFAVRSRQTAKFEILSAARVAPGYLGYPGKF